MHRPGVRRAGPRPLRGRLDQARPLRRDRHQQEGRARHRRLDLRGPRGRARCPRREPAERPGDRASCWPSAAGDHVTYVGWQAIDRAEAAAGEPHGRPRVKFCRVDEMVEASTRRDAARPDGGRPGRAQRDDRGGAARRRGRGGRRGRRRPPARDRRRAAVRGPDRGSTSTGWSQTRSSARFDDGSIHALSIKTTRARLELRRTPERLRLRYPGAHGSRSRAQAAGRAGDRRQPGAPVHEGHPRGAALRLLDAGRRRARAARRRLRRDRRAARRCSRCAR